jgi:YVTN family beta-propeller protein
VVSSSGGFLAAVNPDSSSVSIIDLASNKVTEIPVGRRPRTIALSANEKLAWVTNQDDNLLTCIDLDTRKVRDTIRIGHQPYGVVRVPGGSHLLVTNQGDGTVMWIDSRTGEVKSTAEIKGMPRAIAVTADGKRAYVSDYLTRGDTGTVTVLEIDGLKTVARIELVEDPGPDTPSSGRGFPNQLSALAISPGGESVWVGCLKSNTRQGLHRSGEPLEPTNHVRGMLAMLDKPTQREKVRRRIDLNNADMASAIAFSPNGRFVYVTHQGTAALSAYDLASARLVDQSDGTSVSFASRIDVGLAPQGIVLSADGHTAYVANFMSRSVSVVDVSDPKRLAVVQKIRVTSEPLAPAVALGKQLFYSSAAPRMSRDGYTACASCHADGNMSDGRTWDFTQYGEGLRNTIDLRGRGGMAHGPVHWSANFDEIQDFEIDIVNAFGGEGLITDGRGPHAPLATEKNAGRSEDLDSLAAYLASLTRSALSPNRMPNRELTAAAKRGRDVFYRTDVGCARFHVPPHFTDSTLSKDASEYLLHDVGTLRESSGHRLGGELRGIDTPTLKGLWDTFPYLHDGRAATLLDVLTTFNENDRHGLTSHLSKNQLIDLVAFLLSIDESDDLLGE